MISPSFDWQGGLGREAVRYFFEEQRLRPHADIDALIFVSDIFAFSALQALFDRNIQVPDDIALVGFNNTEQCQYSMPPLTSVAMPFYEQGVRGVEILHALLQGGEVPEQTTLPAQLIIRQSCGCPSPAVSQLVGQPSTGSSVQKRARVAGFFQKKDLAQGLAANREQMLAEMEAVVQHGAHHHIVSSLDISAQLTFLLDSLCVEVRGAAPGEFVKTLSWVLRTMTLAGYDVNVWQRVLSVLRPYVLPAWADKTTLFMVQTLLEQARITIGEVTRQNYGYRHFQERQYSQAFNAVGRMLITTFDVNELLAIITREFPKLGIPSCGGRYS